MYNAFWRLALFVRGQSFSVKTFDRSRNGCQVIREGGGKRFSGAFRAGASSPLACLLLARPFFLVPTTCKRLLRRLDPRDSSMKTFQMFEYKAAEKEHSSLDTDSRALSLQRKPGRVFSPRNVMINHKRNTNHKCNTNQS